MNIEKLVKLPESKILEFKQNISPLKQIMRTIVAFANTAGGVIVIGQSDKGEVTGVGDPLMVEEQLSNAIADSISPMIMPEIDIVSLEGKYLLCIRVAHWPGPFYLKSEGDVHGVYIRLGSTTRQAGSEFIAEIKRQRENKSFDQLPCPAYDIEALDNQFIEQTFNRTGRKIKEQQLVSLGILTPYAGRNVVTYGGVILFGRHDIRRMVVPDARVSCARFRGTDKAHFLDKLDMEGSIIDAIKHVPGFIARNTRLFPKIAGMVREDIPAYPDYVMREILVNSVVHCDYSLAGMRVMVAIFADRLEIQSPGVLPFGMTLDDFKAGISRIRNRVIARTLRELGIMEEWGSGYKRIVEFCQSKGYPVPDWQEIGPVVRVTVWPHPEAKEQVTPQVTPQVTQQVETLLSLLTEPLSRKDLQGKSGLRDREHFRRNYLQPALQAELIAMTNPEKPRAADQKYYITENGKLYLAKKSKGS